MSDDLLYTVADRIAHIQINKPEGAVRGKRTGIRRS